MAFTAKRIQRYIATQLTASAETKLVVRDALTEEIYRAARLVIRTFRRGGTLLLVGNGGSAADAQHLAAEFIGRFRKERTPFPAIALSTNASTMTALANDYGGDELFSRSVEAFGRPENLLVVITTSGNSRNILNAVRMARKKKMTVVGLLGRDGGAVKRLVNLPIVVPSFDTPRIQEAHTTLGHIIVDIVERTLCP